MTAHVSTVETVLEYEVLGPSHFCFNLEAARWPSQRTVSERLAVSSGVQPHRFMDERHGNRFFRFDAAPGPLIVNYEAEVEVDASPAHVGLAESPLGEIPDDVFRYLMPTRYCESDVLSAASQQMFGGGEPGLARVERIVDWLHRSIRYAPGSSDSTTTARDVFLKRTGVCRDFSHLGITFCRALNIPARLVAGYVWFKVPPQDFHAVFEAWIGGRWVMFDATGMAPVDRLVRTGTGRDAKDVAFSTIFGAVNMTRMEVVVREHEPRSRAEENETSEALSSPA